MIRLKLRLCLVLVVASSAWAARAEEPAPFAVVGARVFDGERMLDGATVLVRGGRIEAVGPEVEVPEGVERIDGSGATLLPGLIDAHTHTWGDALRRAIVFGVTTELDQFTMHSFAAAMRAAQAEGRARDRADFYSAGTLVTAPGGHGTEYGVPIPTISAPGEAGEFVAARLAEGSDWIKIIYESATVEPIPAADPALRPYLMGGEVINLEKSFPPRSGSTSRFAHALDAVRVLHAAGVPILAGTDAPNPGTTHGASLHQELELLVRSGLSPAEALAAATAAPADAFGLEDRGRIAPGKRADLLLVEGDPTSDITVTRRILRVWKGGWEVERRRLDGGEPMAGAAVVEPGLLADFEDGLTATAGLGWQETTDEMMGGASTVEAEVLPEGAGGSGHALELRGTIRPGFA